MSEILASIQIVGLLLVDTMLDIFYMMVSMTVFGYAANLLSKTIFNTGEAIKDKYKGGIGEYIIYFFRAAVHVLFMNVAINLVKLAPNFSYEASNVATILVGPFSGNANTYFMGETKALFSAFKDMLGI